MEDAMETLRSGCIKESQTGCTKQSKECGKSVERCIKAYEKH
jgi:hypothetical protein